MPIIKETRVNPTTLSLAIAMTALAAGPALATPANDAFNSFKQVCGDTHGDYAAVSAAAAGGAGWKPSQILADSLPNVTISDRLTRTMTLGDVTLMLAATTGANPAGIS